ncbi:hypothetical protein TD95_002372 [Thielaviopsis punctulata]|uniref:UDP-glucose 6-dehydrogenase n=1 Tax=Thielaviopsis punctulata TaxID=72032 RepID=A0A0F4ZFD9_9PEZI|nr:hypothetical protein TD95_002372 [Thielaviopsis punctulata]
MENLTPSRTISPSKIEIPSAPVTEEHRDSSTAPSTPEGSPTFSPLLRAVKSDELARLPISLEPVTVQTICCVGGPTAAVIAFQNPSIRVTVVDKDESRIRRWMSPHPPIYEPGLDEIVRAARDGTRAFSFSQSLAIPTDSAPEQSSNKINVSARAPNLFFSTDVSKHIAEADVVLIAVNTPTKMRGMGAGSATDMTSFEAVIAEVAQHAKPGAIIVEKSTVPCCTAQMVKETMAVHRPGVHFEILSNPEFLAAGTAVSDLLHPDRILIGSASTPSGHRAAAALAAVYASWIPSSRILTTNVFSSELAKLVANSLLAQRISSINSISAICEHTGADVSEVAAAVGLDPRIGDKFLCAGIGFGGSCFRKDVLSLVYLAESLGLPEVGAYWRQVIALNEYQRSRFARRVVACLNNTLRGKKIAILGYAFKKNTSDTRESPALELARTLLEEAPREVAVFDPCCNPLVVRDELRRLLGPVPVLRSEGGCVEVYDEPYAACHGSHAIVIATEFDEFRSASKIAPRAPAGMPQMPDPRPHMAAQPTPAEILALHNYLQKSTALMGADPLQRFVEQPKCAEDCPDCRLEKQDAFVSSTAVSGAPSARVGECLDWVRVAYHMHKPKWVFDGRGVVAPQDLAKLGIRVESIGRQ